MRGVAWPRLMDLGLRRLGLAPAVFWDLTPAELGFLLGEGSGAGPMSRGDLAALMERFPDEGERR